MKSIAATAFFAAILAGACALAGGSPPVQIFNHVQVRPAHPSAPPDAVAQKFCLDKGFTSAGAHLFTGFDEGADGSLTAHFRRIACRTYDIRKLEKLDEQASKLTVGQ